MDLPLYLIEPVILTTILYWMVGLNPDLVRFFVACGIILLVTQVFAFYSIVLIYMYIQCMWDRVFRNSRFSLKKKAEPTKHKPGGYIERIQKDF